MLFSYERKAETIKLLHIQKMLLPSYCFSNICVPTLKKILAQFAAEVCTIKCFLVKICNLSVWLYSEQTAQHASSA